MILDSSYRAYEDDYIFIAFMAFKLLKILPLQHHKTIESLKMIRWSLWQKSYNKLLREHIKSEKARTNALESLEEKN